MTYPYEADGTKYGKYVVKNPKFILERAHHDFGADNFLKGMTCPDEVYFDGEIIEKRGIEVAKPHLVEIGWVWDMVEPNPCVLAHAHPNDEFVFFIGSNPKDMRDLGAEIEFTIGEGDDAEVHVIDTTTVLYFPAGLVHGPLVYKSVERPHVMMLMGLEIDDYY
jgi:hypothetical protein